MKILILGGDGMLGHQLLKSWKDDFEVMVTLKEEEAHYHAKVGFDKSNSYFGVNLLDEYSLLNTILIFKPDIIVNASGVIKYRPKAEDKVYSLMVNSLLPHRLAMITKNLGIKLISFSTDCVFTGKKGYYTEDDSPDSIDIYGQTKAAGEIRDESHCLTLRTSFFGLELKHYTGLIEWFLGVKGKVSGYSNAIYSGITTLEVSRIISHIIKNNSDLHGLYHLATTPINKYELLSKLKTHLSREDIDIQADGSVSIDRSLNAERFRSVCAYQLPEWDDMLAELAQAIKIRGN